MSKPWTPSELTEKQLWNSFETSQIRPPPSDGVSFADPFDPRVKFFNWKIHADSNAFGIDWKTALKQLRNIANSTAAFGRGQFRWPLRPAIEKFWLKNSPGFERLRNWMKNSFETALKQRKFDRRLRKGSISLTPSTREWKNLIEKSLEFERLRIRVFESILTLHGYSTTAVPVYDGFF